MDEYEYHPMVVYPFRPVHVIQSVHHHYLAVMLKAFANQQRIDVEIVAELPANVPSYRTDSTFLRAHNGDRIVQDDL
jgi:hypothetical protein